MVDNRLGTKRRIKMSSVNLVNLTKYFGDKKILDNINLQVNDGEIISLLGLSGCGKSTTLKLIAGLLKPDNGDILFNGESALDIPTEKRDAVIVFQDYLLFPHMNVYENIEFGMKMRKVKKSIRQKRVLDLLELVRLEEYKNSYPSELSGGQRQRVAIARALAVNPRILLLDEPFSNLDINLRGEMRDFVLSIQKKTGITTILVTHDKEEALMMSDKVAVMVGGQIKQFDTPNNLYERPNSKEVANIFGERNYIRGTLQNGLFKSELINFKSNIKEDLGSVEVMISKEDLELKPVDSDEGVEGKILKKRYAGEKTYYNIKIKDSILKATCDNNLYNENDLIKVSFSPKNEVYFR